MSEDAEGYGGELTIPPDVLLAVAHYREQLRRWHGGKGRVMLSVDESPGRPPSWKIEVQASGVYQTIKADK